MPTFINRCETYAPGPRAAHIAAAASWLTAAPSAECKLNVDVGDKTSSLKTPSPLFPENLCVFAGEMYSTILCGMGPAEGHVCDGLT